MRQGLVSSLLDKMADLRANPAGQLELYLCFGGYGAFAGVPDVLCHAANQRRAGIATVYFDR